RAGRRSAMRRKRGSRATSSRTAPGVAWPQRSAPFGAISPAATPSEKGLAAREPTKARIPMGLKTRIEGVLGEVLTAVVTPFRADGAVDYERFRELAQFLVEHGSDGLVVAGTTGESPTLTDDERLELFRVAVDALGGRGTVVAGTGTYSTAHSVHLTREAHELGVDGFLVVTPYYSKPPPRGIVEHFRAIADVSDRPIIVYNIPGRVVVNIEPETIVELAEIPTVRAVKQANDDLVQ